MKVHVIFESEEEFIKDFEENNNFYKSAKIENKNNGSNNYLQKYKKNEIKDQNFKNFRLTILY